MTYPIIPQQIPQDRRAEINEKILFSIDTGKEVLTNDIIYNCYTGLGGLHNLNRDEYTSYHEYAEAKKEIEIGQFFTPHKIAEMMVGLVSPDSSDMVLDMCCGMGNFFNFLPNIHNAYGFDIDLNAVKVARKLYPDANLEVGDIRRYEPEQRFDYIIGNPPFNLDFNGSQSQYYYCSKAYSVLNPGGLLILVTPCSFLQSDFWNKRQVSGINNSFSFIGQTILGSEAFSSVGVSNFRTKIMVFMRESAHIECQPYEAETFLSIEQLKEKIEAAKTIKNQLRLKLHQESVQLDKHEKEQYEYRLKKYLFELKTHKHLHDHYNKAMALVTKFRNQRRPQNLSDKEYEKWEKSKLTYPKVLAVLKRYIKNQYVVKRKEIRLVQTKYGFKLKQYAPRLLDGVEKRYTSFVDLVAHNAALPYPREITPEQEAQYRAAQKIINRKIREYELQSLEFETMQGDPVLDEYINGLTFINGKGETCSFTDLQKKDMGLLFQKKYSLLNWQQGSGKTAVVYHYAKYLLNTNKVRNAFVLAPAIATNLTWNEFLYNNGEVFTVLKTFKDFDRIKPGTFIVISDSMLGKLKKGLKKYIRKCSNKLCLIFDESDEISNPDTSRTKETLSIFRRLSNKMLATGTTTRNNVAEFYPQLELLYNNSVNMLSTCEYTYYQNKDKEIESTHNDYYGEPFPPRGGATHFKRCFCPGKASVFGIEKLNQDIYNADELLEITGKTIITRKFREFAGDKYDISSITVMPTVEEQEVFIKIIKEFYRLRQQFYKSTGDGRKDAALKLALQIKLLIKACSTPTEFPDYKGDKFFSKARVICQEIEEIKGKVAVGCTSIKAVKAYKNFFKQQFPHRKLFVIMGEIDFDRRLSIIKRFEETENGILLCTQQSLKSSANIPSCDEVFLEALQWNMPRMEQFFFRFIRFDSEGFTRVRMVTYANSIEQNLLAMIMDKQRSNDFMGSGIVTEEQEIFEEYGIDTNILDTLFYREKDDEGDFQITWGNQQIYA